MTECVYTCIYTCSFHFILLSTCHPAIFVAFRKKFYGKQFSSRSLSGRLFYDYQLNVPLKGLSGIDVFAVENKGPWGTWFTSKVLCCHWLLSLSFYLPHCIFELVIGGGCGFGKTWKLTKSSHHKSPWTNLVADSLNRGAECCGLCEVSYRFLYCGGGVQLIRSWVFFFFVCFFHYVSVPFNSLNYYDDLFWNTVTFWGLSEVKTLHII